MTHVSASTRLVTAHDQWLEHLRQPPARQS